MVLPLALFFISTVMDAHGADMRLCDNGFIYEVEEYFPTNRHCGGHCDRGYQGDTLWRGCNKVSECKAHSYKWWHFCCPMAECHECKCKCEVYCRDGEWAQWAQWSCCTKTCGTGTRERKRTCEGIIGPGNPCPGSDTDTENCNQHACRAGMTCPTAEIDSRIDCEHSSQGACEAASCCWDGSGSTKCYVPPGQYITTAADGPYKKIEAVHADQSFFVFDVMPGSDVYVGLGQNWPFNGNTYEVVIAKGGNEVCIRGTPGGGCVKSTTNSNLFDPRAFNKYWVKWSGGHVAVGKGATYGTNQLLEATMSSHPVSFVGVKTEGGHCGVWEKDFCDFDWPICFPGTCAATDYQSDPLCNCPAGFVAATTIDKLGCSIDGENGGGPSIETCRVTIEDDAGGLARSLPGNPTTCSNENEGYANFAPTKIRAEVDLLHQIDSFVIPSPNDYPFYVTAFDYGLQSGSVTAMKVDKADAETTLGTVAVTGCNQAFDASDPLHSVMVSCTIDQDYTGSTSDGERACIDIDIVGSGFLDVTLVSGSTERISFNEVNVDRKLCVLVDLTLPSHCSEDTSPCSTDPMVVTRISVVPEIPVTMEGWYDPTPPGGTEKHTAGIEEYHIDAYEISADGGDVLILGGNIAVTEVVNVTTTAVVLPKEPRLYAFVMAAKDRAGNVFEARRLVIYDATSQIISRDSNPITTVTATAETDYLWQITLDPVNVTWSRRFFNDYYSVHDVLKPFQLDTSRFDGKREQSDGELPVSGTHHIDGIVTTKTYTSAPGNVDYTPVDSDYADVTREEFDATQQIIASAPSDGDAYNFWIKVGDITTRTVVESHLVYVDSSPPELTIVGLKHNGVTQLFVHHHRDLPKMQLYIHARDPHSNIRTINWMLGETPGGSEKGEAPVPVRKLVPGSPCPDSETCHCPLIGDCAQLEYIIDFNILIGLNTDRGLHNRIYYFTVNITNEARLATGDMVEIHVDESPPVPGHVFDGVQGSPDVDFIQDTSVQAYWNGFFDHESGVRHFRYAIADVCLTSQQMLLQDTSSGWQFDETTDTFFTGKTVSFNQYFITVEAFNHAMDPSEPVCSDGVTVDTTPPVIKEVTLYGANIKQGVGCWNNSLWVVWANRTKQQMEDSPSCNVKCQEVSELAFLATVPGDPIPASLSNRLCQESEVYDPSGAIGLHRDSVELRWQSEELESQIHDFQVGISSTDVSSAQASPDIIGFQSVSSRNHFVKRHSAFGHGSTFYIILRARNKALLETFHVIGPIILDETPPEFAGSIVPEVTNEVITVSWSNGDFSDPESGIKDIFIAVGTEAEVEAAQSFTSTMVLNTCGEEDVCLEIPTLPVKEHNKDAGNIYRVYIRGTNGAGLFTIATSEPFTVPSLFKPTVGTVLEIDTSSVGNAHAPDIDFSFSHETVCARWQGFVHVTEEITYEVGLGTLPGIMDIAALTPPDNGTAHCFTELSLTHLSKYYVTVVATSLAGTTTASSDGIMYVNEQYEMSLARVYDGEGCLYSKELETITANANIEMGAMDTFNGITSLMVGKWYTVKLTLNQKPNPADIAVKVNGREASSVHARNTFSDDVYASFMADISAIQINVQNNGPATADITSIKLLSCRAEVGHQSATTSLAAWWNTQFETEIQPHISHYSVAVTTETPVVHETCVNVTHNCSDHQGNETSCVKQECNSTVSFEDGGIIAPYVSVGLVERYRFSDLSLRSGHKYFIALKVCFQHLCMTPKLSDGIVIFDKMAALDDASATAEYTNKFENRAQFNFMIQWKPFLNLYPGLREEVTVYQWTISVTADSPTPVIPWQTRPTFDECECYMIRYTMETTLFWDTDLYAAVIGYTSSGVATTLMQPVTVTDHVDFVGTGSFVYDLDHRNILWNQIQQYSHSRDIAHLMRVVHNNEVDYWKEVETIGAVLTGSEHKQFTWWITPDMTVTPEQCAEGHPKCIQSVESDTNSHIFRGLTLENNIHYFICVFARETSIRKLGFYEFFPAVQKCSNGFLVDLTPPVAGTVHIGESQSSLQMDITEIAVQWGGFYDIEEITNLKHHSGIADFILAIGSFPGGEDIYPARSVGLTYHHIATNLKLLSGHTYYAKVTAVDHVGLKSHAVSTGLTVDVTPPTSGRVHVGSFHRHMTAVACRRFEVHWMGFWDEHSATLQYEVAVGNYIGAQDVMPFTRKIGEFTILSGLPMMTGHTYYVQVKAINQVWAETVVIAEPVVCDDSAPNGGFVSDGPFSSEGDIDYQASANHVSAHWGGFVEPESVMIFYRFSVGTAPGTADVRSYEDVGTNTAVTRDLHLDVGVKYYVTVEACNPQRLCSKVTSDGIVADVSPPIPGTVLIGYGMTHGTYLSNSKSIAARWYDFHDPQSQIHHFEWCIGTTVDGCDIMDYITAFKRLEASASGLALPEGQKIYITVKAVNNVNMSVTRGSRPSIVDLSPPVFVRNASPDPTGVSIRANTQIERSQARMMWEAKDDDSGIMRQTLTCETHHDAFVIIDNRQVDTATRIAYALRPQKELYDGDTYYGVVTACNGAGLCSISKTDGLLVDSSKPILGGLWEPMTWETIDGKMQATIKWNGFSDAHSDIDTYYFKFGTSYDGAELSSDWVSHKHDGSAAVQKQTFPIDPVSNGDKIYITMYATNNVGLKSAMGHVSVISLASDPGNTAGSLDIEKHSCELHSCDEHCSCGIVGLACDHVMHAQTCTEVPTTSRIVVKDGWSDEDEDVTGNANCLRAHWTDNNPSGPAVLRFEWSAGLIGDSVGAGIFNLLTDVLWHDVNLLTEAVHCLERGQELIHEDTFVFYIKAWWSETEFEIFTSNGIQIDKTPPSVAVGGLVRDLASVEDKADIDFTDKYDSYSGDWRNTFRETTSQISDYEFALGTVPGADNVVTTQKLGNTTNIEQSLTLEGGERYIATVKAYNEVGFSVTQYSDGLVVDRDPPIAGVVHVGSHKQHFPWQRDPTTVKAFWFGFTDLESFVRSYSWCIGTIEGGNDVLAMTSVNMMTSAVATGLSLTSGQDYFVTVECKDAFGLSITQSSPPFQVDTTPPVAVKCNNYDGTNLITGETPGDLAMWSYDGSAVENADHVLVQGRISYQVALDNHQMYQVEVTALSPCDNPNSKVQVGFDEAILDFTELSDGTCVYTFQFLASEGPDAGYNVNFTVSSDAEGIKLTKSSLKKCSTSPSVLSDSDSHQTFQVRQLGAMDVFVSWAVDDPESGIHHYQVGLGTTPGGFQVAPLTNLGRQTEWAALGLRMAHRLNLYVTVIAVNVAGLRSAFTSEPLLIDWTPPDILPPSATVNPVIGKTDAYTVSVRWDGVTDAETGIKDCSFGLGSSHGTLDIMNWQPVGAVVSGTSPELSLSYGQDVYPSVRCHNNVDLYSVVVGDKVVAANTGSDVTDVTSRVYSRSPTPYPTHDGVQTDPSTVNLIFGGFSDMAGIDYYQVKIEGLLDSLNIGQQQQLKITGLSMSALNTYKVSVKAVNMAGQVSEPVTVDLVYSNTPPTSSGSFGSGGWHNSSYLHLDWSNVFTTGEPGDMVYEVTAGTVAGSSDVLPAVETQETQLVFTHAKLVPDSSIYVTVKAVAPSGLYTMKQEPVNVPAN